MLDVLHSMLAEYRHESGLTRQVLMATPDDHLEFRPVESAHTIAWNAGHLADIPSWMSVVLEEDSFDVAPPNEPPHESPQIDRVAEAVKRFDENTQQAVSVMERFDPQRLNDLWTLQAGGQPIETETRWIIYRRYMINHVAHHRGHLLAYLRICGVETPLLYGG